MVTPVDETYLITEATTDCGTIPTLAVAKTVGKTLYVFARSELLSEVRILWETSNFKLPTPENRSLQIIVPASSGKNVTITLETTTLEYKRGYMEFHAYFCMAKQLEDHVQTRSFNQIRSLSKKK